MNPQTPQATSPQPQQATPQVDQANNVAASLAFATHLSTQMLSHQNPAPEGQGQAQGGESEGGLNKVVADVEKLKEDAKGGKIQEEIDSIKSELEALLQEEDNEPTNESPK